MRQVDIYLASLSLATAVLTVPILIVLVQVGLYGGIEIREVNLSWLIFEITLVAMVFVATAIAGIVSLVRVIRERRGGR